jgi:hypothetical protein
MIYGITLIVCNAIGYLMIMYVWYHPHLAVPEFSKTYIRRHTPVYVFVNVLYLGAILVAHPFPLLSYLIYILVVIFLIVFLPKLDDGIRVN